VFTGLVADLGEVVDVARSTDGAVLTVATKLADELGEGDSVAVNGVCLTATAVASGAFTTEVMNETLRLSSLAEVAPGARVNLELAARPTDRLGGHIVQGHVDGVGEVVEVTPDGFSLRVKINASAQLLRYVVHKGSIAVDGISLTVASLATESFTVSLIPETLERTNLGDAMPGMTVNLEVDVVAKYVERLVGKSGLAGSGGPA
jgi:riboflavin synthase